LIGWLVGWLVDGWVNQDVLELLKLSDRYILEHLKGLTEQTLKKYIDVENVNSLFVVLLFCAILYYYSVCHLSPQKRDKSAFVDCHSIVDFSLIHIHTHTHSLLSPPLCVV
jgi:hypothetical protein